MRKFFVALALLGAVSSASVASTADDHAYLGIFAETSVNKMPGMRMPALPPGMDMSKFANIPGMQSMLNMGASQRKLSVRLWSPGIASQDAYAYIASPKGLKQGDKLNLDLYRPQAESGTSGDSSVEGKNDPDSIKDFTIKIYWGSSKTVKAGQPKIIRWDGLPAEAKTRMREEAKKARRSSSYFYKPDWTTGYWPAGKQKGIIAKDASLTGTYSLTTNYTGNVSIDVPSSVDFLAPIELSSPNMDKSPALDKSLDFEWTAIPEVLGFNARIIGMQGKNTMILWSSAESYSDDSMGIDWDYMQMADVTRLVKANVMMSGSRTSVDVPEGIFKDCDMSFFSMIGYGPGVARDAVQPLPRVQTKTTLSIMPLGGKQMKGMPSMDMPSDTDSSTPDNAE